MHDETHHDEEFDGEASEIEEPQPSGTPGGALEARTPATSPTVTPQVGAFELRERLSVIEEAMSDAMQEGVDFGKVPGTGKPALFKPGAEKLSVLFRLDVQPRSRKSWGPGDHLTVETFATVFDIPTGARIGFGEGLCTTREGKYAFRLAELICPACGKATIIKGKEEYGGGWICFLKKGGCGAKYADDEAEITGQERGEVPNPRLPDTWNTVVKMAEKRARVDAVLAVTGASALFTQDLDEVGDEDETTGLTLAIADEEQKGRLKAALEFLLPPTEAEKAWGEIKQMFGGALYGPAAEAVIIPIRAAKQIREDEEATAKEAEDGERAEAERRQAAAERGDPPAPEDEGQSGEGEKKPPAKRKKGGRK